MYFFSTQLKVHVQWIIAIMEKFHEESLEKIPGKKSLGKIPWKNPLENPLKKSYEKSLGKSLGKSH